MYGNDQDRRVRRTRSSLHEALAALIHEKSYGAISVKDLLARANVGRSTFYMHFTGKDQLLASGIEAMLRSMRPQAKGRERIVGFARPMFDHIHARRSARSALSGFAARAFVHERLRESLAASLVDDVRREFPPRAAAFLPGYVAATFVFVLDWWLDRARETSAADADRMFRDLVEPALDALEKR